MVAPRVHEFVELTPAARVAGAPRTRSRRETASNSRPGAPRTQDAPRTAAESRRGVTVSGAGGGRLDPSGAGRGGVAALATPAATASPGAHPAGASTGPPR